jgi:FixJ family two-component response regulator
MSQSGFEIAVIDDEAPVCKALGRLLRAAGHEVETFASGGEFLESLQKHQPDCAIVDLHMPAVSGLEVQQRLVREEIRLPCIVITGKDDPGARQRVLASGAAAYLKKPLDEQALLEAVVTAVTRYGVAKHVRKGDVEKSSAGLTDESMIEGGQL